MRLLPVLLFSLPLFAQTIDLSVRIIGPERVVLGQGTAYVIHFEGAPGATLEIDLPGTLLDGFGSPGVRCELGKPIRCTLTEEVQRFSTLGFLTQAGAGTHTATVRISGAESDPPGNNLATLVTEVVALPSLTIESTAGSATVSPREPLSFPLTVVNKGSVPATNVTVTVTLPAGGEITGFTASRSEAVCSHTTTVLTCTMPQLTLGNPLFLAVAMNAPGRVEGAPFTIEAEVRADEQDFEAFDNRRTFFLQLKRELLVLHTGDSGNGSLRQAMLDANQLCLRRTPCNIAFQIPAPVPAGGKFVIQPRTPLPALVGDVKVDGRTQTMLTGDTNPNGPEIEISGELLTEGVGLRLSPNCEGEILDLAVTGFPEYGIDVSRMNGDPAPEVCYAGGASTIRVLIARNHLIGNTRGLGLRAQYVTVEENVISGNRRAGIFASDGGYAFIRNNRIESNGASGVFLHVETAEVERNTIANNEHWAIARTLRGDVLASANSIFGNTLQGIDVGLDGETPRNRPVLFWAIYDPARRATVIRGRFDGEDVPVYTRISIELFASDALSRTDQPQAERSLIELDIEPGKSEFEIAVAEDLRGKWITAVSHVLELPLFAHGASAPGNTSELSNAVFVAR